jgi:hypothetical protein
MMTFLSVGFYTTSLDIIWPHGFGVGDGQWIKDFDHWVTNIFENN